MFTWISSQTVFTSEQILIFQLICLDVVCFNSGLTGMLLVMSNKNQFERDTAIETFNIWRYPACLPVWPEC